MAVPLHLTGASCLRSKNGVVSPQASLSCATKLYTGLKSHSTSLPSSRKPNLTVEFFETVHKSLKIRSGDKKGGGRVSMMPIGTPRMPYKTPGEASYQWVDLPNIFYREGVIFLGQEIDEEYSNQILATLLYLDFLGSYETILLYINCPGGDLTPCLSLYDTIRSMQTPIDTLCLGAAIEMAGFILAAGQKGSRVAMPLSKVELGSPEGTSRGRADDVLIETRELVRIRDYLFNELAKNTGQPVEKVHKDLAKVKHFPVKEAMEYGIIDRVVQPARATPENPPQRRPPPEKNNPKAPPKEEEYKSWY